MDADPHEGSSLLAHADSSASAGSGTKGNNHNGKSDEHALKPRQAIKAYPMAIFWTLAVSMTVIMEGVGLAELLCELLAASIADSMWFPV
jgi:hypothetical protein